MRLMGGRVPFTIPLSWFYWFYLGLSAYLLGSLGARARGLRPVAWWGVALGGWFLTVWDLVLDPALAHESLPVRFWGWHETGPYFGMPLHNVAGWTALGLLFMAVSRLLWRSDPPLVGCPSGFRLGRMPPLSDSRRL